MYRIKRTAEEIDEQMNRAWEEEDGGSRYPGMTYEQGIRAAIDWITTDGGDEPPMPEE